MKILDRIISCILALGCVGHAIGSCLYYKNQPLTLLWALSASLLWLLVALLNFLRVNRPQDRVLAWICFAWCLALAGSAFAFGAIIGNLVDPRAVINGVSNLALAAFSLRTVSQAKSNGA